MNARIQVSRSAWSGDDSPEWSVSLIGGDNSDQGPLGWVKPRYIVAMRALPEGDYRRDWGETHQYVTYEHTPTEADVRVILDDIPGVGHLPIVWESK